MARARRFRGRATVCDRDPAVSVVIPRHRHQSVADGGPLSLHALGGCVLVKHAGFLVGRHAVPAPGDPHVLGLVLLGLPRKSASGHWLPLRLIASPEDEKGDRKSTRLNSSHSQISYAVFCLKKKKKRNEVVTLEEQRILKQHY